MNDDAKEPAKRPTRKPARKTTKKTTKELIKETANNRKAWMRGFYMLLMLLVLHLAGTLLVIIAIVQFMIALVTNTSNERLTAFGHSLGSYLQQIAHFVTYSTEEVPFPFSEWPVD